MERHQRGVAVAEDRGADVTSRFTACNTTRVASAPATSSSPCAADRPTATASSTPRCNRALQPSSPTQSEVFDQLQSSQPDLPVALVEHGRRALAEVSAAVFGHPERKLKLSAVTGTNGKTTTTFLLEQLLASVGRKSVLLGTIETHIAGEVRPTDHTTPESRDIYAIFAEGVKAGCTEAVMEMSSHALEQERVWGLPVDVAIYTNLTQDHLDFHGTMDAYARAKAKLFAGVGAPPPRVAVINEDDPYAVQMRHSFRG